MPTIKTKKLFVSTASLPLFGTLRSVAGRKVDDLGALYLTIIPRAHVVYEMIIANEA